MGKKTEKKNCIEAVKNKKKKNCAEKKIQQNLNYGEWK